MFKQFLRWVFGKAMETRQLTGEKLSVFWGMPILASDAISSVAYAVDEMLWVLIPVVGVSSFIWMPRIAMAIVLLLLILTFSYRQVVEAYPNGGGAYIVAKDNLGTTQSLVAGASLQVGYIMTVAVSICSGTNALVSAAPGLFPYRVAIAVLFVLLLVIGNIRGVRESSRIFSFPTYAFILSVIILIIAGLIKFNSGGFTPVAAPPGQMPFGDQAVTLFILLTAFSSGCSALTGVEAVSNAVPNFKDPAPVNAKKTYLLLALSIVICFGGVTYLTKLYNVSPTPELTGMAQMSMAIFGKGAMFYIIQATTTIILAMAANTAFAGFPTLLSIMAQDGWAPRQMAMRGHRLNYTNGISFLAFLAIILIIAFKADTHLLIPLYAVGVFAAFTLSQTGMFMHWIRLKSPGWKWRAFINGLGALTTMSALLVVGVTKFKSGAWIVFLVVPCIIWGMQRIKRHYVTVAEQLDIPNDMLETLDLDTPCAHHIIVPIDSFNAMVVKAVRYARSITPHVEVFHVETYEGEADKLRRKWAMLHTSIPLIIKESPYREVVGPLIHYIDSEEHESEPGDMITVLLPQFFVYKWYHAALHNNTSIFIANAMLNKHNVIVSILPFYLEGPGHVRRALAESRSKSVMVSNKEAGPAAIESEESQNIGEDNSEN